MKSVFVMALAFLLTFTACDSGSDTAREGQEIARSALDDLKRRAEKLTQEEKEAEAQPRQVTGPRIALKGTELTYNGKLLRWGAPLEEWSEVIGEKPRPWLNRETYYFDKQGLEANFEIRDGRRLGFLEMVFNNRPKNIGYLEKPWKIRKTYR